jgi:peptidase MA superfamily protein
VTVYVARTADEMVSLAPEGHPYPGYAAGVAYPYLDLVLLTVFPKQHNPDFDLKQVFKHELAHLALKDAVAGAHVPRWLNEGFAVHFSGESSLERMKTLWTASLARTLLPLREIDARFPDDAVETPIAYAESADVVRYMLRTRDRERFMAMLRRVRNGQTFDNALSDAYGLDVPRLEEEWLADVAKRYSFLPVLLSSMVWMSAIGLFVVGYYRRRKQQSTTLKRWAVEEAAEDAARAAAAAQAAPAHNAPARMHIVIAPRDGAPTTALLPELARNPDVEVPKVEHEGSWHTLH